MASFIVRHCVQVEVGADVLGGMLQAMDAAWLSFAAFAEDDQDGSALAEAAFVMATLDALTGGSLASLCAQTRCAAAAT